MNTLYLVRHGESSANITKEFSCLKVDPPLTEKGVLQAEQTADYFAGKPIDAIYSSPLLRAKSTAETIARRNQLPVTVVEEFREMNVGDLEGTTDLVGGWAICNRVWTAWLRGEPDDRCPGGEDLHEMRVRFLAGIAQVVRGRENQNLIVVAHGGILTAPLRYLCPDADFRMLAELPNHNCSITKVEVEEQDGARTGRLIEWANLDHLHGAAAAVIPGWVESGDPI